VPLRDVARAPAARPSPTVLKVEKVDTSEIVDKNLRYTKYLESVLDIADDYHEIPDLLMRYATLEAGPGPDKRELCRHTHTPQLSRCGLNLLAVVR